MKVVLEPHELAEIYALIRNIGLSNIDRIEITEDRFKAVKRQDATRILSKTQQASSL